MKTMRIFTVACMVWAAMTEAMAQNATMTCADITAAKGEQVDLPIEIANDESLDIVGITFKLQLPEGATIMTDEDGDPMYELVNSRLNSKRFTVYTVQSEDGAWGFAVTANNESATLKGVEGPVMNITLEIANNMVEGEYTISMTENKLSVRNAENLVTTMYADAASSTLTVSSYDGISPTPATTGNQAGSVFDLQGRRMDSLGLTTKEGVYVVTDDKGAPKKMVRHRH